MDTKFQDNTIVSLEGKVTYGPHRSYDMANNMADGWGHLITQIFDRSDDTAAFIV